MKKIFFYFALFVFLFFGHVLHAAVNITLFDRSFTRGTGQPVTDVRSLLGVQGPATIYLYNGDAEDSTVERVSSSVVTVNGITVFDASNFNQNVYSLTKKVTLNDGDNTISVLLKSKPGGTIRIKVVQTAEDEAASRIGFFHFRQAVQSQDTDLMLSKMDIQFRENYRDRFTMIKDFGILPDMAEALSAARLVYLTNVYAQYAVTEQENGIPITFYYYMKRQPDGTWRLWYY